MSEALKKSAEETKNAVIAAWQRDDPIKPAILAALQEAQRMEREECAKVCKDLSNKMRGHEDTAYASTARLNMANGALDCEAAIRARKP